MNFPEWFGKTEFYAVLATVWFGIICYTYAVLLKFRQNSVVYVSAISKLKTWFKNRKEKKMNKIFGGE